MMIIFCGKVFSFLLFMSLVQQFLSFYIFTRKINFVSRQRTYWRENWETGFTQRNGFNSGKDSTKSKRKCKRKSGKIRICIIMNLIHSPFVKPATCDIACDLCFFKKEFLFYTFLTWFSLRC